MKPLALTAAKYRGYWWLLPPLVIGIRLWLLIPRPAVGVIRLNDAICASTAKDLIAQIRHAPRDAQVRAVVLTLHSPGGTVIVTEATSLELARLRQVKPVVTWISGMTAVAPESAAGSVPLDPDHSNRYTLSEIQPFVDALTQRGAHLVLSTDSNELATQLKSASSSLVVSLSDAFSPEEIGLRRSLISLPSLGNLGQAGDGLLLFKAASQGNALVLLAASADDVTHLLQEIGDGNLAGCMIQGDVAACSIGCGGSFMENTPTPEAIPAGAPVKDPGLPARPAPRRRDD